MAKMRGAETLLFVLLLDCWQGVERHHLFLQVKGSKADSSPSSANLEEGLAKIFDEIFLQVFSSAALDETRRTAGKSITKRAMKESSKADSSPSSANLEEGLAKIFGHVSEEERNKEPFLFNRAVSEQYTTVKKEILQETAKPGNNLHNVKERRNLNTEPRNKTMPCSQLLLFLQRNIVIAAISVAGILVATGLLLLVLTRKKQPLYPPANMTYNVFIMNGKSWWQKSQEKNSKTFTEKQKQLNCDSCV
ncbi:uncharacterized protein C2orf92 homolog [Pteropus medius]|uniref:uncharacterized protein C2orf92 homolog n=1 Tax=Pteropus vampyrus TaxID=132908 RepID=UPI00196A638F|nr:uncharacterized protein C2orf92 homolog [Pteropus giganteus]